jgi:Icc protein
MKKQRAHAASFWTILPLMKLARLTDPHLNFVGPSEVDALARSLRGRADAALITGDIGEADSFAGLLRRFTASAGLPLWFVLGNHDAYRGSLSDMRAEARTVPATRRRCPSASWRSSRTA